MDASDCTASQLRMVYRLCFSIRFCGTRTFGSVTHMLVRQLLNSTCVMLSKTLKACVEGPFVFDKLSQVVEGSWPQEYFWRRFRGCREKLDSWEGADASFRCIVDVIHDLTNRHLIFQLWTRCIEPEMRSISAILNGGPVHWLRNQRSALVGSCQSV
jgi:hypothetical protein